MRGLQFLVGAVLAVGATVACGEDDNGRPSGSGGSATGGSAGSGGSTAGAGGGGGTTGGAAGTGGAGGSAGSTDGGGGSGGSSALVIAPSNEVLVIDAAKTPVEASAVYSAKVDGKDVTPTTAFTIPSAYGSFVGALFTSTAALPGLAVAGTTTVQATAGPAAGSTKLSLIRLEASGSTANPFVVLPYGAAAKTLKTVVVVTPAFGATKDITLALSNNAANGTTDATKLVVSFKAMATGDGVHSCASASVKDAVGNDGIPDIFTAVASGLPLCFEITFKDNAYVFPQAEIRSLVLDAVAIGQPGAVKAPAVPVYIFVPPTP
jgi:hypothetical protein